MRPYVETGTTSGSDAEVLHAQEKVCVDATPSQATATSFPAASLMETPTSNNEPRAPVGHEKRVGRTGRFVQRHLLSLCLISCALAGTAPSQSHVGIEGGVDGSERAVASKERTPVASDLRMGTADPHGLELDGDEGAWMPRRGAAFSVLAHARADDAEVARRAFPAMNVPPCTAPVDLPPASVESPPMVTSRDQVIPPKTQALVSHWKRRAKRCMRFAELGLLSKAKRMRPPDLWLPCDDHQTAETRAWAWDLSPLAQGQPAQPLPVSGRDGVEPDSSLKSSYLQQLKREGVFEDKAILDELIGGVRDDVLDHQRGTLLCAPHVSALQNWTVAQERTSRNVAKGWAFESELPCWPIRACPYGVVDESERAGEPKFRLTNDLSWPPPGVLPAGGGEFVQSHNASMDRGKWAPNRLISVRQYAEAVAIMRTAGAPMKLWSLDCDSFYRKMGRQLSEIWRNAMAVPSGFQLDRRCCFGSAADAAKCARVSNVLAFEARKAMAAVDRLYPTRDATILQWQQARREARDGQSDCATCDVMGIVGLYIDDAPGASFDDPLFDTDGNALWRDGEHVTRATAHFEAVCEAFTRVGHESKASKEQRPRDRLDVLGVTVDLASERMWLQPSKALSYARRVTETIGVTSLPRLEYLRLLGRLQFAAALYPLGRQWLHAAWRVARARFRLQDDRVQITARVRRDLKHWLHELTRADHEGVPLACRAGVAHIDEPGAGAVYADASGGWGWAAWTVVGNQLLWCGGEWSDEVRTELHINEKELYASTAGLFTLAEAAGLSSVYSFTDSAVALGSMRSFTSESPRMQELLAARATWMLERKVAEAAFRVSSKSNLWADLASRGRASEMEAQATALGLRCCRLPLSPSVQSVDTLACLSGDTH